MLKQYLQNHHKHLASIGEFQGQSEEEEDHEDMYSRDVTNGDNSESDGNGDP
jgi:hypothetical protein